MAEEENNEAPGEEFDGDDDVLGDGDLGSEDAEGSEDDDGSTTEGSDDEDDDEDEAGASPAGSGDDDEDEPDTDEVEADLNEILRDRIAADEDEEEDDEEGAPVPVPAGGNVERQQTELHCPHCFLLIQAKTVAETGECGHCGGPIT